MKKSETIAVAMSGGVDSSAAAAILARRGLEAVGVTFMLGPGELESKWARAAADAEAVCRRLGIEHRVADFSEPFRARVLEPAADRYSRGLTPNPCVECNRHIKFGAFLRWAESQGFDRIATGHYARVFRRSGAYRLCRGLDRNKDQAYVLWGLAPEALERIEFPLGRITKQQARTQARELGLEVHDRRGSQELCFAPPGRHAETLERWFGPLGAPGPILTRDGREIGVHKGLHHYTLGQRRGLGVAWPHPLYVIELDPARNAVIAGADSELRARALEASAHWLDPGAAAGPLAARVRIRYNSPIVKAMVFPCGQTAMRVEFSRPQRAVTPGQSVVIYAGDRVLGGGVIERVVK